MLYTINAAILGSTDDSWPDFMEIYLTLQLYVKIYKSTNNLLSFESHSNFVGTHSYSLLKFRTLLIPALVFLCKHWGATRWLPSIEQLLILTNLKINLKLI